MSDLEYQQAYRSHKGQASMAQHRAMSALHDDDVLPPRAWRGFQILDEDGEWYGISSEHMTALLSAYDADIEANIGRMKAGGVMRLGNRKYRRTEG